MFKDFKEFLEDYLSGKFNKSEQWLIIDKKLRTCPNRITHRIVGGFFTILR